MSAQTILTLVLVVAAFLSATGVIYARVIRPMLSALRWKEEVLPVLNDIAAQFRTDSGSSLRDELNATGIAVGQIKDAAEIAHAAAQRVSEEVSATSEGQRRAQDTFKNIERLLTEIRDQKGGSA